MRTVRVANAIFIAALFVLLLTVIMQPVVFAEEQGLYPIPIKLTTSLHTTLGAERTPLDSAGDLVKAAALPPTGHIGNLAWYDIDGDGVQDFSEPGLENVTVRLYDSAADLVSTTTTAADGSYVFSGLAADTYFLIFTIPDGFHASPQDQGGDDTVDSDVNVYTGKTGDITLSSGENDVSWDAGFYQAACPGTVIDDFETIGLVSLIEPGTGFASATGSDMIGGERDMFAEVIPFSGLLAVRVINFNGDTFLLYSQGEYAGYSIITWDGVDANQTLDATGLGGVDLTENGSQDELLMVVTSNSNIATVVTLTVYSDASNWSTYAFNLPLISAPTRLVAEFGDFTSGAGSGADFSDVGALELNIEGRNLGGYVLTVHTIKAGCTTASSGDFVWHDLNANGVQDAAEPGLPGISATLYLSGSGSISATTTNASGYYSFTSLISGTYYTKFDVPQDYYLSPQSQGGNAAKDSDADPNTAETVAVRLISGEYDSTGDAGLYQLASLGDTVWHDLDADGIQDGGEPGLQNVTVRLYLSGTGLLSTTMTNSSGFYTFTNIVPGDYYIEFEPLPGYGLTAQDQEGDDAVDSDPDPATGQTSVFALVSGTGDDSRDAGMYVLSTVDGFVWDDLNGDGIRDFGEPGIPAVSVTLHLSGTGALYTTTTDASGLYSFTQLYVGDYFVEYDPPLGFSFSPQDQGSDDSLDSDPDVSSGQTAIFNLGPATNDLTRDAALYQPPSIGDYVWYDLNADGIQDGGESGLSGVTVTLHLSGSGALSTTTTNSSGFYSFTNLIPGDYSLEFDPPENYYLSPQDVGGDDTKDSDPDSNTGRTITTTLISGDIENDWDAGAYQSAAIGNFIWHDLDADGVQDAGEPGLPGITVTLYISGSGALSTTLTNSNGVYNFTNLPPDDYYMIYTAPPNYVFSPQDQGGDDELDSDADASGQTEVVSLSAISVTTVWDAGLYQRISIGDLVWYDLDTDGIQDGGEPGLNGVTVQLFTGAGVPVASTPTAPDGSYSFDDLTPGSYYLVFTAPTDYRFSPRNQGGDDTVDSDPNTSTGRTSTFSLVSGDTQAFWDSGLYKLASLGNKVWDDLNADGIQNSGEPGLTDVTVKLFSGAGVLVSTKLTESDGSYNFNSLEPGSYYLVFTAPTDYRFSPRNQGGDDTVDSDPNTSTGRTSTFSLVSGDAQMFWDSGLYRFASLGNKVWDDLNADGIQNPGEPGLANVTVKLFSGAGALISTKLTASNGSYNFNNLVPGSYYLSFTAPAMYHFSPRNQGGDDTVDSDPNVGNGKTSITSLISGQAYTNWDAGLVLYRTFVPIVNKNH